MLDQTKFGEMRLKKSDIRFAQEISIPARRARSEERSVLRYSSTERGEATQQGAKSTSERYVIQYPVTIAERIHLYPSRTQKLSSQTLMILGGRLPGKVGSCRFEKSESKRARFFSCLQKLSPLLLYHSVKVGRFIHLPPWNRSIFPHFYSFT